MFQGPGLRGFLVEALQHFLITGESFGEGLDRDLAIELPVKGAINQTHSPATEKIDHFVLANALNIRSGHGSKSLHQGEAATRGRSTCAAGLLSGLPADLQH